MGNRRTFILQSFFGAMAMGLGCRYGYAAHVLAKHDARDIQPVGGPLVVSTWSHGLAANDAAWRVIMAKGKALDAVEKGVNVSEADPTITSVGYGGMPDATGKVTLDACIMGPDGKAGSVGCLEHILHPISVARKVMERTPHVMLTGKGALQFALDQGFEKTNLLTQEAKTAYRQWKKSGARYAPMANWENHDTIGLLALDVEGDLAGACTTSGMAFKHSGRIGDSPIIGAGLFVDNQVGAATATGEGEVVMRTLGSFLIVELMRNGLTPLQACEKAVHRLTETVKIHPQMQVGYIAVSKKGDVGAYALRPGFQYAYQTSEGNRLIEARSLLI